MNSPKHRLLVLTDISSLTPGVRESDDGQSMVRLMLYANEIDIEGLIASSNMGHGNVCRPELIREVVDAYAQVRPNLLLHDPDYPTADFLRERIKGGQPAAGPKTPVFDSIGRGKDTEASDWIVRVVDKSETRPLWVTIWGGSADLAQALWSVRESRSPSELAAFVSKLRVHSIGDQDSTGVWLKDEFPDLYYISRTFGYRGMYRGGDESLSSSEWVETHVTSGHGSLGDLYPNYNGGDIWSGRLGGVRGVKAGDTPSFLPLIRNRLFNPDHPEYGSWGGRMEPSELPHRLIDSTDGDLQSPSDPNPLMSSTYRWRPAFQADFQARLDWCVKTYAAANHPPTARIAGDATRDVSVGETVALDASDSAGPDGGALSFSWQVYPKLAHPQHNGASDLLFASDSRVTFRIPEAFKGKTVPILLTVTDDGEPQLAGYARVVLRVRP